MTTAPNGKRDLDGLRAQAAKLRIDHFIFPPHLVHAEDEGVLTYDANCVACVIPKLLAALAAQRDLKERNQ